MATFTTIRNPEIRVFAIFVSFVLFTSVFSPSASSSNEIFVVILKSGLPIALITFSVLQIFEYALFVAAFVFMAFGAYLIFMPTMDCGCFGNTSVLKSYLLAFDLITAFSFFVYFIRSRQTGRCRGRVQCQLPANWRERPSFAWLPVKAVIN